MSLRALKAAATRSLARQAGLREVDNLRNLVHEADLVLSVLVPSEAEAAATAFAVFMGQCAGTTHYVDCNAVSPQTAQRINEAIRAAGGVFR